MNAKKEANVRMWMRLVCVSPLFVAGALFLNSKGLESVIEHLSNKGTEWVVATTLFVVFTTFLLAVARWITAPYRQARRSNSGKVVTGIILVAFLTLVFQECRAEDSVVIATGVATQKSVPDGYVRLDTVNDPVVIGAVNTAIAKGYSMATVSKPECYVQYVIYIIVIGGIIYVGYKLVRACMNISKRRNKQIDRDDDDSGSNTNHNRSAYSRLSLPVGATMYCASFIVWDGSPTASDTNTCDCLPPFGFRYGVESGNPTLVSYVPTNTVDLESYLIDHGLDTNLTASASYSYNGVATNYLSEISFDSVSRSITVNLPGIKNAQPVTLQSTTNMRDWTAVGTITAPVGARIKADFGSAEGTKFWRLSMPVP